MDFKKNNPFAAFGFGAPKGGSGAFGSWGQGGDTSAYARVEEATERLFSSLGESMRGGPQSPYAEMMENFFRQNNIAGPQRDSYMQLFLEMNQVAGRMVQSIVQQQQQYLLQLLQMTGQVVQKQYDPNQPDKRCGEESRLFTERTAKHCAAVSNTILQANQEIYQRFLKMCQGSGDAFSSAAADDASRRASASKEEYETTSPPEKPEIFRTEPAAPPKPAARKKPHASRAKPKPRDGDASK